MSLQIPLWVLAMGGVGIVVGLICYGWRIIQTIGVELVKITPSRGFAIELSSATTVIMCSILALPVSTTHAQVCYAGWRWGLGGSRHRHVVGRVQGYQA